METLSGFIGPCLQFILTFVLNSLFQIAICPSRTFKQWATLEREVHIIYGGYPSPPSGGDGPVQSGLSGPLANFQGDRAGMLR